MLPFRQISWHLRDEHKVSFAVISYWNTAHWWSEENVVLDCLVSAKQQDIHEAFELDVY